MSSTTTILEYSSLERTSKWKTLAPPLGFPLSTVGTLSTFVNNADSFANHQTSKQSTKNNAKTPNSTNAVNSLTSDEKSQRHEALKAKRAWDLATSPARQLPMQLVMVYFSGGGVQIFSMGMVAMLIAGPFKAWAGMNEAFTPFAPLSSTNPRALSTLWIQKVVYMLCSMLTLVVGVWKCNQMGLLPMGTGDWLAFETRKPSPDISFY